MAVRTNATQDGSRTGRDAETDAAPRRGLWRRLRLLAMRLDDLFSRYATAAALAEYGTRDMALERLQEPESRSAAPTAGDTPTAPPSDRGETG